MYVTLKSRLTKLAQYALPEERLGVKRERRIKKENCASNINGETATF